MSNTLRGCRRDAGFTALEILLATSIAATMTAVAVPLTADALDEIRAGMAARYLEGRIMDARMQAVKRSARVGLRFEAAGEDYRFAKYLDGNGNGIRTAEVTSGVDPEIATRKMLRDSFAGVRFGLRANVPDVDGSPSGSPGDGVRIGVSRILSLGPDGTATSGTLYVHGRRSQYAVRILGATGRTRLLRFDAGTGQWMSR